MEKKEEIQYSGNWGKDDSCLYFVSDRSFMHWLSAVQLSHRHILMTSQILKVQVQLLLQLQGTTKIFICFISKNSRHVQGTFGLHLCAFLVHLGNWTLTYMYM